MAIAAEKTPSAFGVYFTAVLLAILGAILGFVYMSSFSAQAFSTQAEYEASLLDLEEAAAEGELEELGVMSLAPYPGNAYYIEGEVVGSRTWERKREQLMSTSSQTVTISAGQINAWMTAKFLLRDISTTSLSDEEKSASLLIMPGVPNVGIASAEEFYINLPATFTSFGASGDFIISARYALLAGKVKLRSVSVRSAKVPFPGLLGAQLIGLLMQGYEATEEYQIISETIARADSIEVVGNNFVLQLR